jgi:flagellar M-ring protein FliF
VVKQVGGILVVILLILMVLRPAMKRLTSNEIAVMEGGAAGAAGEGGAAGMAGAAAGAGAGGPVASLTDETGAPISLPGPGNYESILEAARRLVDEDPKRVAQLVKSWAKE